MVWRYLALFAALFLASTFGAQAASLQTCQGQTVSAPSAPLLCSRTLYASGPCTGRDTLAMLKGAKDPNAVQWLAPWEPVAITIVGYRIVTLDSAVQYAFAGNSYTPDVMGWLSSSETSHGEFYPSGTGFAFPAIGVDAHLDLHYSCLKNTFQGFYTVFYTISNDAPSVAAVR